MRFLLSTTTAFLSLAAIAQPALATGSSAQADAGAVPYHVVKVTANDVLNMRQGPSSGHAIVAQLPADATGITLTGACHGSWCPVRHSVGQGWVFKGYIAPATDPRPQQTASLPSQQPAAPEAKKPQPQAALDKASSPPEQAFRFFVTQGWSEHHAAGIVGNLQAECGQLLNCSNGSGGLAQWRGDRVSRFQKVFGYPFARAKFADQLAYIHWELTHPASPWKDSGHALRRANDAGSAAALFDAHYERSSGSTRGARMANARALLKRFGNRTASAS